MRRTLLALALCLSTPLAARAQHRRGVRIGGRDARRLDAARKGGVGELVGGAAGGDDERQAAGRRLEHGQVESLGAVGRDVDVGGLQQLGDGGDGQRAAAHVEDEAAGDLQRGDRLAQRGRAELRQPAVELGAKCGNASRACWRS